jgi:polysulfide reductase chain C
MAEHFVQSPHWEWWILAYFFLGGLTGGLYVLATMLRLWGSASDEAAARIGFLWAFPLLVLCPIFLTIDLGRPLRFWHMLLNTTPGRGGLSFISWSPMSVGSWVLLLYGFFSFVSFLQARAADGRLRTPMGTPRVGGAVLLFNVIGAILGAYVVSYTGVLLSVSNQPVWSDSWALGGLFLASGLSASSALLAWLVRDRRELEMTEVRLHRAERYFAVLELILLIVFLVNLSGAGTLSRAAAGAFSVVWILVFLSLVPPLVGTVRPSIQLQPGSGTAAVARAAGGMSATTILVSVLVGTLLLRFAVIFSAQF